MDRYAPYDRRPRKKKRIGGGLLRLADGILLAVTLPVALALALSYFSPHVDPNRTLLFAFAGLAAPALMLANIVALLYWAMRWRWWALVPLATLLAGPGCMMLTFRPSLLKTYPSASRDRNALTVVSHNVHGFLDPEHNQPCFRQTTALLASFAPDVLCIQEYQITPAMPADEVEAGLAALPQRRTFYKVSGHESGFGLAIFSRLPVAGSQQIDFEGSTSCFMWADVVWWRDTLRIYNCHFQTTSIDAADKRFVTSLDFAQGDSIPVGRARSILAKLGRNFRIRAVEADSLAAMIHNSPYDVVVCGDFNDTPMSYSYHTIRGRLRDSFVEHGGASNTFNGLYNIFRIDYILHSRSLATTGYENPVTGLSDHNPVAVTLKRRAM
ncbi:MAG: endonuclease/exonuclease/phosphatase family protein [Rikenellaceae bacterium]|nr:endonuclease/exonuclease/phosphatase family protein [Rikenellaceae bacterium]